MIGSTHPEGRAMANTTIPESHRDLLDASFLTLGTIGPDGLPQLTEVWFLAEDGQVRISLNDARRKMVNLRANPACSVLILDVVNPYRYVELRGMADIRPDTDLAFATRVGAKYSADLSERDLPGQTRSVVTIVPSRVHAWG
jgi:PPOX class probable F420-dependent enzyme